MNVRTIMACLAGLVTAACATTAPPPPPDAVLQFTPAAPCAAISAANAVSLTPERPVGLILRTAAVGAPTSACYGAASGGATPYAMFALPDGAVASVNAGAMIEARRVLGPQVATLDAGLNIVRTFAASDFHQRGRTYSVLFRPRGEEKYVLVSADAALVGGRLSFVSGDPATAQLAPHLNEAYRADLSAPFSLEGSAFARVYFDAPVTPGASQSP